VLDHTPEADRNKESPSHTGELEESDGWAGEGVTVIWAALVSEKQP